MADQLLHVFEYNQLPKVADVPGLELTGLHDVLCRQRCLRELRLPARSQVRLRGGYDDGRFCFPSSERESGLHGSSLAQALFELCAPRAGNKLLKRTRDVSCDSEGNARSGRDVLLR